VNKILDYLAFLFENGYEYSTICSHRSAILAFHEKIDGKPTGEHPYVSSLINGIFNRKPPQPNYSFIRDVQQVIDYITVSMKDNCNLSDKLLSLKVTMLLALTSVARTLGLHFTI